MKTILENRDARYLVFQPGDGTMYRAFLTHVNPDQVYVAIGANPYIRGGGYVANISSLEHLLEEIYEIASTEGSYIEYFRGESMVPYWQGHLSWMNEWTAIVGLLLAAIYTLADIENDGHVRLIGYIYNNDHVSVRQTMDDMAKYSSDTVVLLSE